MVMSNSNKVAEIFTSAGDAFARLGDLTMQLQGGGGAGGGGGGGVKWTDEEVDMLHTAVRTFAEDLNTISETIKQRTVQQIKTALKKKAYEEAGIQVQSVNKILPPPQSSTTSAEVTLNALNAGESEVDSEGLSDFGSGSQVR